MTPRAAALESFDLTLSVAVTPFRDARLDDGPHNDRPGISLGELYSVEGVVREDGVRIGEARPDVVRFESRIVGQNGVRSFTLATT